MYYGLLCHSYADSFLIVYDDNISLYCIVSHECITKMVMYDLEYSMNTNLLSYFLTKMFDTRYVNFYYMTYSQFERNFSHIYGDKTVEKYNSFKEFRNNHV